MATILQDVAAGRKLFAMDVLKMLAELRDEKTRLEDFIAAAERYAAGTGKRRGRPPAWMTELKRRGRPPGSKNKAAADGNR